MQINHDTVRTVCVIVGTVGGAATAAVAMCKFIVFLGKALAKLDSVDSIDRTLKEMASIHNTHGEEIVQVKGRVHGLEKWREEVIEDSRSNSGIFANKKAVK